MKRLLPALLGLSLLLTACPQPYTPVEVTMDDPRVLQGRWEGEQAESVEISAVSTGGGRVYLGEGLATNTRFGPHPFLRVMEAGTGTQLARLPLPGAVALAYRSDGRLVVLKREGLDVYEAATLRLESSRSLTGDWQLSRDGRVVSSLPLADGRLQRLSTLDGTSLPTVALGKDQALPLRSSDDRWWVTRDAVVRSADGFELDLTNSHTVENCYGVSSPLSGITAVETLPPASGVTERLLLGYQDGFVEVRDLQGRLLNTFQTPGGQECLWMNTLLPLAGGQQVAYQRNWDAREMGLLDLQSGAVTPLPQADLSGNSVGGAILTRDGVLYRTWQSGRSVSGHHFVGWEGGSWALATQDRDLTLDVQATRTGDRTADLTGTARLDGRPLAVRGTLDSGMDAKLKPQIRPFLPELRASLILLDGERVVARVTASTNLPKAGSGEGSQAPAYTVFLQEQDTGLIFEGQLRRP